jgi:hypothetical protein
MTQYLNQAFTPRMVVWWFLLIFSLIHITTGLYDKEPYIWRVIPGIIMVIFLVLAALFDKWAGLLFIQIDQNGIVARRHYIQKPRTLGWNDIASVELSPTYLLVHAQHEKPDIIIKAEQDPEDHLRTAIIRQADQKQIPVTHAKR